MRCWIALHISITTESAEADAVLPGGLSVQRAVACIALGFTPRVALVDEAVLLDVTGSLRLFGGLARLMQLLDQRLKLFFEQNSVVAAVERAQGATSLIAIGKLRWPGCGVKTVSKRVADLPLHTLTAARPHLGVLERIGCRTWDDLLRLPRDGVARRFGAALLEALDRARGDAPDNYSWRVLPEHFEEKLELDALVTQAPALMTGVSRLLVNLQAWLLGRQSGLSALQLTWHLDKRRDLASTGQLEIRSAQPAQDLRHMARLLAEHLAQQKLPAPVHSLSLQSLVTEPLVDSAAATGSLLMQPRQQGDSAVELVERLSARLGEARVQAWQACADHRPEQMQRWVTAQSAIKSIAACACPTGAKGLKRTKTAENTRIEALYPTWLLPEPLKLATVGNSPVYQGPLVRLTGPQRLEAAEWLLTDSAAARSAGVTAKAWALRDYFIYRSPQGSLLWIYSERLVAASDTRPQRAWYLHGFFA